MDSIPQQILLQVILILVNAFFASAEIAVISLNVPMLRKQAEEGNKTAKSLLKMAEEPSGFCQRFRSVLHWQDFWEVPLLLRTSRIIL